MQTVNTHNAPAAIGPYSQAVMKHDTLFVSGQLGIDPATGEMLQGFENQAEQVFRNIKAILKTTGMDFSHVMKVTVFLKNMGNFAALNEIYARNFSTPYPAREAIEVARLPKDGQIEISVIAMR